jgi:hypothetical protein
MTLGDTTRAGITSFWTVFANGDKCWQLWCVVPGQARMVVAAESRCALVFHELVLAWFLGLMMCTDSVQYETACQPDSHDRGRVEQLCSITYQQGMYPVFGSACSRSGQSCMLLIGYAGIQIFL